MKTSFWQKIALILFGIFLALVFLETGLRLSGSILSGIQEHRNSLALRDRSAYRIMCIGESTTQYQYPSFLEEILNRSDICLNFSVIDKGIGATNTSIIASHVEENIRKYSPDMVVAMIGINDGGTHMPPRFNDSLKVYNLARLILMHIKSKINEISPPKNNAEVDTDSFYIEEGDWLRADGQIDLAKEAFRKAIELDPDDARAYFKLAWLSDDPTERKGIYEEAFQHYKRLIEEDRLKDMPKLYSLCVVFAGDPETQMYLEELEGLLKKVLARDPENKEAVLGLAYMLLRQSRYAEAEEILKRGRGIPQGIDSRLFDYLAILYHDTGRPDISEYYLCEANKLRYRYYSALTSGNYRKIKAILDRYNIRLVCVQYPLRSIEDLKRIFEKENNIIFVDNESCFKDALKKMSYKDLFRDMFAGDFGHCTDKGNRLLAENIANVILKAQFGAGNI